ncbi:hypothetical protein AVEN_122577-1 [Araneus ventricosus]|uniref:Fe2OG dioxygenase domain-containing protein n=1 Tax=Araneus ventricosus TaxID=182803 RepID=A0A4Y2S041_ARAVE|nr:hypothetical protein AVEN_122577-1 [Araneus ventricosus]
MKEKLGTAPYFCIRGREREREWGQCLMERLARFCEGNDVLIFLLEPNGHAKIGAHKDDKPSLDQSVDIATLSFGAFRDMIFSKKGCKSVRQALEAGSLFLMHDQKEWTHAIPPQPCVKEPRISLTFRRVWSSLQQSLDEMERDYSIPLWKRLSRE